MKVLSRKGSSKLKADKCKGVLFGITVYASNLFHETKVLNFDRIDIFQFIQFYCK